MGKIIELTGKKNRWKVSSLGARMVGWEGLDGSIWRKIAKGNGEVKASEDGYRAAVMFPWVNRIGGEHWALEGNQVPVNTKKDKGNLHGLTFDSEWEVKESTPTKAVFHIMLEPSEFYPKRAECTITYTTLDAGGSEAIAVDILASNPAGEKQIAYVTTGIHPYFLNPFGGKVDPIELTCRAAQEFPVDDKLIPTGIGPVTSAHDFTKGRKIGDTLFDSGFLLEGTGKRAAALLSINNFHLSIYARENCHYVQVYIPPDREEIAIEPQSGGADAFRFHQFGLRRLKPGESFHTKMEFAATFA